MNLFRRIAVAIGLMDPPAPPAESVADQFRNFKGVDQMPPPARGPATEAGARSVRAQDIASGRRVVSASPVPRKTSADIRRDALRAEEAARRRRREEEEEEDRRRRRQADNDMMTASMIGLGMASPTPSHAEPSWSGGGGDSGGGGASGSWDSGSSSSDSSSSCDSGSSSSDGGSCGGGGD